MLPSRSVFTRLTRKAYAYPQSPVEKSINGLERSSGNSRSSASMTIGICGLAFLISAALTAPSAVPGGAQAQLHPPAATSEASVHRNRSSRRPVHVHFLATGPNVQGRGVRKAKLLLIAMPIRYTRRVPSNSAQHCSPASGVGEST